MPYEWGPEAWIGFDFEISFATLPKFPCVGLLGAPEGLVVGVCGGLNQNLGNNHDHPHLSPLPSP